ncbi:hypothetical protein OAJ80_00850 [Candidatus Thioglobus sp.]|nr:hypothetical protein [Candidatus Thioglobus sp.]
MLLSILISFNSYGDWIFHNSSSKGDTFYLHIDSIKKNDVHVFFWYMKSYLIPDKFGDFSAKVYVQGDCKNNRLRYLIHVWYKEPMGQGLGERSDKESEWEYPTSDSIGKDLLNDACNS